ncbi:hypothetical protein LCGC14_0945800 [marine sediment metagenome]|uniref:Uncharacterized protein n=1 Tax=marine sediment metagenome TaxID=412755 RepID=A0A0F9P4U8_9ZZZZ
MGKPSATTRQHMLAACGNRCAYPDCDLPIFDIEDQCLIGTLCHIKGNNPGSARYDESQPENERQSFSNLMAMCRNFLSDLL